MTKFVGLKDSTSVNPDTNLGDLGLDSLMGVEVKQTLERDYDLTISTKDILLLTFAKLDELSKTSSTDVTGAGSKKQERNSPARSIPEIVVPDGIRYEVKHLLPCDTIAILKEGQGVPLFVVHPIEGSVYVLEATMARVDCTVYGLQCTENAPLTSLVDLAKNYVQVYTFSFIYLFILFIVGFYILTC